MIYLVVYLGIFILVGAVAWHMNQYDEGRVILSLYLGLIGPIVIVAAIILIPIRILAVRIGPVVDAVRKQMKGSNNG